MFEVNGRKYRYRTNWRGKLILQVQVRVMGGVYEFGATYLVWRDARVGDIQVAG
uniref:Uncharacterized protein n=1 Tax=Ralstonia solanacearum TaxID=305 RepID=A0A0S4TX90_RALSL|nr:conserved protein of unknown function [Ralstonia solanacearum]